MVTMLYYTIRTFDSAQEMIMRKTYRHRDKFALAVQATVLASERRQRRRPDPAAQCLGGAAYEHDPVLLRGLRAFAREGPAGTQALTVRLGRETIMLMIGSDRPVHWPG
jgi:hypothetical protein